MLVALFKLSFLKLLHVISHKEIEPISDHVAVGMLHSDVKLLVEYQSLHKIIAIEFLGNFAPFKPHKLTHRWLLIMRYRNTLLFMVFACACNQHQIWREKNKIKHPWVHEYKRRS